MVRQAMVVFASQTDVEKIALAETPAVALQVGTEIKLRRVRIHAAVPSLIRAQFELHLVRGDRLFGSAQLGAQEAGHRTKVPAGTDNKSRSNAVVGDPSVAVAAQRGQGFTEPQPGAGALQKVMVELAAAYA